MRGNMFFTVSARVAHCFLPIRDVVPQSRELTVTIHGIVAPKAHLHSSAKDGLGVPGFSYVRVTLILGFLKTFEFFLTEIECVSHFLEATVGPVVAPWIV